VGDETNTSNVHKQLRGMWSNKGMLGWRLRACGGCGAALVWYDVGDWQAHTLLTRLQASTQWHLGYSCCMLVTQSELMPSRSPRPAATSDLQTLSRQPGYMHIGIGEAAAMPVATVAPHV
jgi:hypothetical protein